MGSMDLKLFRLRRVFMPLFKKTQVMILERECSSHQSWSTKLMEKSFYTISWQCQEVNTTPVCLRWLVFHLLLVVVEDLTNFLESLICQECLQRRETSLLL